MCQGLANDTSRRGWRRIEKCVYQRHSIYKTGTIDGEIFAEDNGAGEWRKVQEWLARLLEARDGYQQLPGATVRVLLAQVTSVKGFITGAATSGVLILVLEPTTRTMFYPWTSVVEMEVLSS